MSTCTALVTPILAVLDELGADPSYVDITCFGPGSIRVGVTPAALDMLCALHGVIAHWTLTSAEGAHYEAVLDGVRYWCGRGWAKMTPEQISEATSRGGR